MVHLPPQIENRVHTSRLGPTGTLGLHQCLATTNGRAGIVQPTMKDAGHSVHWLPLRQRVLNVKRIFRALGELHHSLNSCDTYIAVDWQSNE